MHTLHDKLVLKSRSARVKMMAVTWQESCVLSVVVGEGWRGSGGWIWRIMWRKAPSWRPPLTTIKIMHIYMINLAKLSFPVSFILHWLCTDHWAATRSPGPSLTWRDYSVLLFLLRQNGRRGLMITLFPGYLYIYISLLVLVLVDWEDKKCFGISGGVFVMSLSVI